MTFTQAICHKLEKRRADCFQHYPVAICLHLVHLCPPMLLFPFAAFLLCCSTVSSGYCNVSFYFGHFGCHEITSFQSLQYIQNAKTAEKPSNPSRTYHQLSTLKRNIHLPFGRIFKTCLFPGLFNANGTS